MCAQQLSSVTKSKNKNQVFTYFLFYLYLFLISIIILLLHAISCHQVIVPFNLSYNTEYSLETSHVL